MTTVLSIIITFIPVIIAIVAHELAHGWVAKVLGDDTAARARRLSLNPLRHIDLFGTIILPALFVLAKAGFIFGWAKPVPVNFNNLRHPRRDMILVSSAGILMNFYLALVGALFVYLSSFIPSLFWQGISSVFFLNLTAFNIILALFNLLPIPPLDGSKIFFGWIERPWAVNYINSEKQGLAAIVILAFIIPSLGSAFNLNLNIFNWFIITPTRALMSLLL